MSPPFARAFACVTVVVSLHGCGKKSPPAGSGTGEAASAAAAAAPAPGLGLAFLNAFEGEIDLLVKDASKGAKPPTQLAFLIKDGKVRVDFPPDWSTPGAPSPGGKGYGVLNAPEKKFYAVLDDKKQVVLVDLEKAGEQVKAFTSGDTGARGGREKHDKAPSAPPKVTKTGLKDTVAGYSCELWDVASEDGEKFRACVANEGASWFRLPMAGIPTEHAWAVELLDGKHFPLRGIAYDASGTEKMRAEVTKLEKKTLAAALFDIPQGYKVVDLAQMVAAFGNMGNAMGAAAMMGKMPPGLPPGMTMPQAAARGAPPPPKKP